MPTAPRTPTTRALQAIARRDQILQAALKLFAKQGFAATTTRQIAQTVGVTEGLIFRYFPDKRALLLALANQSDETAAARCIALLESADDRTLPLVVTDLLSTWFSASPDEVMLTQMLRREAETDVELRAIVGGVAERFRLNLDAYLVQRRQKGELRPDVNTEAAASLVFSVLMSPVMTSKLIEDTVDCLSRGLLDL